MDCDIIPPTPVPTDIIKPINRDTVHRICSGQVVLSLAIAVKELVENAIDAEATIIDVRLKEYGSDLIEVSDNGKGVVKENFQALTLKHYTSKIKQFDDLANLATLGFRGEALSSLCALSDLTILTKNSSAEHASKIVYDRNGKIVSADLGAREQGTTVTLQNLFSTLPVRRKEFVKNLKREFNKMCQLLYAYCLVSKGIKFSCTNTTNKGSKNTIVSTQGLTTVKDNIINVFGSKQISSLIEVEVVKPKSEDFAEYGVELLENEPLPFTFDFFVSSVMHGSGRSSNDRQFFYINSRPCDPTKVIKLVNETYRHYNNNQYPFIYLNITSKSCLVDVNVTPDKRQVFLEKEKVLLATVKASLVEAFKAFPSTYKMQNVELSQTSTIKDFFDCGNNQRKGLKRSVSDNVIKKGSIMDRFKKRSKTENDKDFTRRQSNDDDDLDTSDLNLDTFLGIASKITRNNSREVIKENNATAIIDESQIVCQELTKNKPQEIIEEHNENNIPVINESKIDCQELTKNKSQEIIEKNNENNAPIVMDESKIVCEIKNMEIENIVNIKPKQTSNDIIEENKIVFEDDKATKKDKAKLQTSFNNCLIKEKNKIDKDSETKIDTTIRDSFSRKSISLDISLDTIKERLKSKSNKEKTNENIKVRFRSEITPQSNKSAEEELQKHISKENFDKMSIIGQFNLGFIITKLENDLFIVDQHATDEKYNFEQLQANTVMENQILVKPKQLELTAGNESLLIENEEIFKKNGFHFKIDESAPCTKKICLTSIPLSKSVVFGKDDIDEMLFMLQDSNTMCRPSRIRAMFASRACRKSVMIGKALSKNDMRKLIDHMGEIEQPWNCPHGRPTMRHLINLDLIHHKKQT